MQSVLRYLDLGSLALAVLVGLITLVLLEIYRLNSLKSKHPPGPTPLPFIGTLHRFVKNPMGFIRSMAEYGELSCGYVGRMPMIMLNTLDVVKEAFVENGAVFSGRPHMPIIEWINRGYGIVTATYGHAWKQQRRFALHTLRDFGLGRKTVEERVADEAQYLIRELLKHEGKALNPIHPIMNAVSNIICSIVFGDRFEYDDKRFAKLLELMNENVRVSTSSWGAMVNMLPIIIHLPGPHQKIFQTTEALRGFIREAIEEHKKTLDPENLRDFIDAYLVEMSKSYLIGGLYITTTPFGSEQHESEEDSTFHEDNLVVSTTDLFGAGTETTATTLRWGLIYMMNQPEIQERCHEEIVRVLGYDRAPSMDDREKLPYTYATVHEIQRYGNIFPFGGVHATTQTTELRGYTIPKGTVVVPNLMALMTDKQAWKHPDSFNPENFLDEDGKFCKNEFFMPFSLGPRVCLGETLARTELFIFFTSLLQKLKFSWPSDAPPFNMEGIVGAMRMPHPFQMICRSRECLTPNSTSSSPQHTEP